MYRASNHF